MEGWLNCFLILLCICHLIGPVLKPRKMAPPSLKVAFPLITTLRIPFSLPQLQGILSLRAFTIHLLRVQIICQSSTSYAPPSAGFKASSASWGPLHTKKNGELGECPLMATRIRSWKVSRSDRGDGGGGFLSWHKCQRPPLLLFLVLPPRLFLLGLDSGLLPLCVSLLVCARGTEVCGRHKVRRGDATSILLGILPVGRVMVQRGSRRKFLIQSHHTAGLPHPVLHDCQRKP
jgi:hypothetical protein